MAQIGGFVLEESIGNLVNFMEEDSTKYDDLADFNHNLDMVMQ